MGELLENFQRSFSNAIEIFWSLFEETLENLRIGKFFENVQNTRVIPKVKIPTL